MGQKRGAHFIIESAKRAIEVAARDVLDLDVVTALEGDVRAHVRGEDDARTRWADVAIARADRLLHSRLGLVGHIVSRRRRRNDGWLGVRSAITIQDANWHWSRLWAIRPKALCTSAQLDTAIGRERPLERVDEGACVVWHADAGCLLNGKPDMWLATRR